MRVRLAKWGNSLGLRIPRDFTARFGLVPGAQVEIDAEANRIVIAIAKPRYRLDDLLVGMTPDAMHEAFDWGPDIGREIVNWPRCSASTDA